MCNIFCVNSYNMHLQRLFVEVPTMVAVIYHLPCHATVDADVFTSDKSRLAAAQIEHHISHIERIAHYAGRLLLSIGTAILGVFGIYPPRRDGVHPGAAGKAHRQRMRQRSYASLGCSIAFGLRLTHTVARRGYIHHRSPLTEIWSKQFHQIEWRRNTHRQSILKILIATLIDAAHQGHSIVHYHVHAAESRHHLVGKRLKHLAIGYIAHKMPSRKLIDYANLSPATSKLISNAAPNPPSTPSHHHDLSFEFIHISISLLRLILLQSTASQTQVKESQYKYITFTPFPHKSTHDSKKTLIINIALLYISHKSKQIIPFNS